MQYSESQEVAEGVNGDFASDACDSWMGLEEKGQRSSTQSRLEALDEAEQRAREDIESMSDEELMGLMNDWLVEGKSLSEIQNISMDVLEALYGVAYQHYVAGDYEKAAQFFQSLVLLNHYDPRFQFALAASFQGAKCYAQALDMYSNLYFLDSANPEIPLNAGICRLALGNKTEAESGFLLASELARDKEEYGDCFKRATALLEQLTGAKHQAVTE